MNVETLVKELKTVQKYKEAHQTCRICGTYKQVERGVHMCILNPACAFRVDLSATCAMWSPF